MAQINSRQAAAIAARTKAESNSAGKKRLVVITSPATATYAANDTIASGIRVLKGARFTAGSIFSTAALGAGVTLNVGIRDFETKSVIDADGIAAAVDVAAAGRIALNNGALVAAGVEYVAPQDVEVYLTLGGAAATANAQFRAEIEFISYD